MKSDELFLKADCLPVELTQEDRENGILRKYRNPIIDETITFERNPEVDPKLIWIRGEDENSGTPSPCFTEDEILAMAQTIAELKEELGYA